eukprot:CAMPEP_0170645780 /NCGR_PEP_ID=MMETSP0224-20130122/43281_1 /TAXON_ID=285029 /ORGANISM="Togula jolla, Strain CCCM 725" /LENGTH=507 /DNA_ID=CAMNT_0010977057 /DNA_START=61 /DNA_END=1585 /DNA_ORIENTATION=-
MGRRGQGLGPRQTALLGLAWLFVTSGKDTTDYYATLDVGKKADKTEIKKAYRAKSLEYHPDKCELEHDVCQAKFIEVSTAYEVLSDDEKRKVYDKHGVDGLKEGAQDSDNAKAMFRQYFGREPDGNVRIVRRGGQMMFVEEGEPGPQENIYDDTSVIQLQQEEEVWKNYIHQRDEPWVVQFYKPNDDESVAIKGEYVKLADTFKDFLKISAVNCRKQRNICGQASIDSFPAIRWFPLDREAPPEIYEGPLTAKALGKWASEMMPDSAVVVEDKHQLRRWLDGVKSGPAVVLFTASHSTPAMWKALSTEFKPPRANLAVVRRCDKNGVFKTPLQRDFDVTIPQVVHLDPLDEHGKIAEKYTFELRKEVLTLWLQKLVMQAKKAGPAATFKEWTTQSLEAGECSPKDLAESWRNPHVEEAMRKLAQKYRTDPIKMLWVNLEMTPSLLDAFALEESETGHTDFFVAFRPKRSKFKVHKGALRFEELDAFVDGTLNGGPLEGRLKVPRIEL